MRTGAERSAAPARRARPGLVLGIWFVLFAIFATQAPIAQASLRLPFELFSLVMLAPALASLVVAVRPSWMPPWWDPLGASRVMMATLAACVAVVAFIATLAGVTGRMPLWGVPGMTSP